MGALYGTLWERANFHKAKYLHLELAEEILWKNWFKNALIRFGTWILVFTNIVPISLIVTLECVRLI